MKACRIGTAAPQAGVAAQGARRRYALLDTIRGATLISMIVYHASWDLVHLFDMDWPWYRGSAGFLWQQSICWAFILLSGFCWPLGRRPVRRGLGVLAAGTAVSIVTVLFVPDSRILFGILTMLGACMLLMAPLDRVLRRVPAAAGVAGCAVLFFLSWGVPHGYAGIAGLPLVRLPRALYHGAAAAFLGFMPEGFFSTDYFPLLPWVFLFAAGYFICRLFCRHNLLERCLSPGLPGLDALGKRSLFIYVIHQPVLYLCMSACL